MSVQRPRLPAIAPWQPQSTESQSPTQTDPVEPTTTRLTLSGEGTIIPLSYGLQPLSAKVPLITTYQGDLIILAIWCLGEVNGIVEFKINGEVSPAGVAATHYVGTTSQGPDPTLVAAIPGYNSNLVRVLPNGDAIGVAYSVIRIPPDTISGTPNATCIMECRKVWDVTASGYVYTTNPGLILADSIRDPLIGMGRMMDTTALQALVNDNDELVGGKPRRTLSITFDSPQDISTRIETLRGYADALVAFIGSGTIGAHGTVVVSPALAGVPTGVQITDIDDMVNEQMLVDYKKGRNKEEPPTVIAVTYTDTRSDPWTQEVVRVPRPGVDSKTIPWREEPLSMPGIHDYAEAWRCGEERLNSIWDAPLILEYLGFDESITLAVGDIIGITHRMGLNQLECKITAVDLVRPGRWQIAVDQYAPILRSNATPAPPAPIIKIEPPSSTEIVQQPVTGCVLEQRDTYDATTGGWIVQIFGRWTPVLSDVIQGYRVKLRTVSPVISEWSGEDFFPVAEGISRPLTTYPATYEVSIRAVATDGTTGPDSGGCATIDLVTPVESSVLRIASVIAIPLIAAVKLEWAWTANADNIIKAVEVYTSTNQTTFPGSWAGLNYWGDVAYPGNTITLDGLLAGQCGYAYLRLVFTNGRKAADPEPTLNGIFACATSNPQDVIDALPDGSIITRNIFSNSVSQISTFSDSVQKSVGSTWTTIFSYTEPSDWSDYFGYVLEVYPQMFASTNNADGLRGGSITCWIRTVVDGQVISQMDYVLPIIFVNVTTGLPQAAGNRLPHGASDNFPVGSKTGTRLIQIDAQILATGPITFAERSYLSLYGFISMFKK